MRIRDGYIIRELDSTYYLLPIGQNIATHKKSVTLNDTSLFFCEQLSVDITLPELFHRMAEHFNANDEDLPTLRQDLTVFIDQLNALDILTEDNVIMPADTYFAIGSVTIGYHGPNELLYPSLLDFTCSTNAFAAADQHWIIIHNIRNAEPVGQLLIRTQELCIYYHNDCYDIFFERSSGLMECQLSADFHTAKFFCNGDICDSMIEELFYGFRLAFSTIAQSMGCYMLHSVSLLYQDKLWLFSGSSGTGKSTHTTIWNRLFETPIINGDINCISIDENGVQVHGIPWCGTSKTYDRKSYALGGIVLLQQSPNNYVEELTTSAQQLYVMQRLISPTWTVPMMDSNLVFAAELTNAVPVYRLHCNTEDTAAITIKNYIDSHPVS